MILRRHPNRFRCVFMTDINTRSVQTHTANVKAEARERGDFYPNSSDQVLDIVHPSFYCAVNGRTRNAKMQNAASGDTLLVFPPLNVDCRGDVSNTWSHVSLVCEYPPPDRPRSFLPVLEELLATFMLLLEQCLGFATVQFDHRIRDIDWPVVMPFNTEDMARHLWERN
ncbi:Aste57867_18658 [Aphanomyces stellatus]|uniref:Aste57867_18658 protein n=1 Tax=Aphanomyces stellatus TaxID=120398 RepID=A0A485LBA4_9STRA|nr:hypothetical protein As57867_018596 [Aphanomyces stellatus]VFT95393.1 Aste57867_18658 [Aphanomyces stellatus]